MAMRWSRWVATMPPPAHRPPPPSTIEIVALDRAMRRRLPRGRPRRPRAGRIPSPAIRAGRACASRPSAKAAATASIGYSSIIDGRAAGRHVDAAQVRRAHAQVGDLLAAFVARSSTSIVAAHLAQRRDQAGAQRVHHHALDHDVRARHDQRRDDREGGRRRVGRHRDRARRAARAALPARSCGRPRPCGFDRNVGAEMARASSRCGRATPRASITVVRPGRVQAGEQHRRLDLRRGDRRAVFDRDRLGRAFQHDRAAPALGLLATRARPSAPADRGCAASAACAAIASPSKVRRDAAGRRRRPSSAACRCRHCRNRACRAGARSEPSPAPSTASAPGPCARPSRRAPGRRRRAQDVLAFQQALDPRLADGSAGRG